MLLAQAAQPSFTIDWDAVANQIEPQVRAVLLTALPIAGGLLALWVGMRVMYLLLHADDPIRPDGWDEMSAYQRAEYETLDNEIQELNEAQFHEDLDELEAAHYRRYS